MLSTFLDEGWDFEGKSTSGMEDIWTICERTNCPRFTWQVPVRDWVCPDGVNMGDLAFLESWWFAEEYHLLDDCGGVDLDLDGSMGIGDLHWWVLGWPEGYREPVVFSP